MRSVYLTVSTNLATSSNGQFISNLQIFGSERNKKRSTQEDTPESEFREKSIWKLVLSVDRTDQPAYVRV